MVTNIIIILVGIIVFLMAYGMLEKHRRLLKTGEPAEGVVFEMESGDNNSSYPIVRFVTKDLTWMTEKSDIGFSYGMLKQGDKVKVFYNPANPKEFIIEGKSKTVIYLMIGISAIVTVGGIIKLLLTNNLFG